MISPDVRQASALSPENPLGVLFIFAEPALSPDFDFADAWEETMAGRNFVLSPADTSLFAKKLSTHLQNRLGPPVRAAAVTISAGAPLSHRPHRRRVHQSG